MPGREHEYDPDCSRECVSLATLRGEMKAGFAATNANVAIALEGVSNFRKHAERANRFFDRFESKADAEETAEKKRWKRSDKIAAVAVLAVILLPPVGWSTAQAVKFFSDLYQITQEYHRIHINEIHPQKGFWNQPQRSVSSLQSPPPAHALNE
jgi:hypothetical protein